MPFDSETINSCGNKRFECNHRRKRLQRNVLRSVDFPILWLERYRLQSFGYQKLRFGSYGYKICGCSFRGFCRFCGFLISGCDFWGSRGFFNLGCGRSVFKIGGCGRSPSQNRKSQPKVATLAQTTQF